MQNQTRAITSTMEFGYHAMPEMVEFALPGWKESDILLLKTNQEQKTQIYIGSTTWNQQTWPGEIYPAKTPKNRFLNAYGASFDTIELNSTHYNIPQSHVIHSWCRQVPDSFKFCPKVPQFISHRNDLGFESGYLDLYLEMLTNFEMKLGIPFIQFPPYFGTDRSELLLKWIEYVNKKQVHAIEYRNLEWFNIQGTKVIDIMKKLGWPIVITDTSGRRDLIHMRLTSKDFIIRFVACGNVTLDQKRLDEWVERLYPLIIKQQLSNIYFFMHDPDHYTLPDMSFYLKTAFARKNIEVRKVLKNVSNTDLPQQFKLFDTHE